MDEQHTGVRRGRTRLRYAVRALLRIATFFLRSVTREIATLAAHARLLSGVTFFIVGLLSFASDRYCDGNTSVAYTCTRPATYYFYPWWATGLTIIGALLISTWLLRRTERK